EDNADLRLTPIGRELGLVDDERWRFFERKRRLSDEEAARLQRVRVRPDTIPPGWVDSILGSPLTKDCSAFELLKRPEVTYEHVLELAGAEPWIESDEEYDDERLRAQVRAQVEVRAKYAGYIERAADEIERQRRNEETALPPDLDYAQLSGLSIEVRQRLMEIRPATLG